MSFVVPRLPSLLAQQGRMFEFVFRALFGEEALPIIAGVGSEIAEERNGTILVRTAIANHYGSASNANLSGDLLAVFDMSQYPDLNEFTMIPSVRPIRSRRSRRFDDPAEARAQVRGDAVASIPTL